MTSPVPDSLATAAIAVLNRNWAGSHTLPATGLYPHQWSWDSGFIALGLRHVDPDRAQQELESLLNGQWDDGRLPQIIYDVSRDDDYSPGASFWRSGEHPDAPIVPTTGLIQPPNHAWAAWEVHRTNPEASERNGFLARVYPRLVAWHEYLATRRNRGGNGLASVVHPWESGMDNSPLWDEALARVPDTPKHEIRRPDLQHADAGERPSAKEYGRYFWLAEQYRDHGCNDLEGEDSFVLEDPTFNALWARSELALADIARTIGEDPARHNERAQTLTDALETLFDSELGLYVARDVTTGALVRKPTISGLIPLILARLHSAQPALKTLMGPGFLGSKPHMVPSYDIRADDFEPAQYWRGPAWFNMTWLVILALRTHSAQDSGSQESGARKSGLYEAEAQRLATNLQELAVRHGFPEYIDPLTGAPHGTRNFSWTAALALDLLKAETAQ